MRIDELLGSKNRPSSSQTFFNFVFKNPAPGPSLATTNFQNTYYYEGKFDRSQSDFCLLQNVFYTCVNIQVQTDLWWLQIVIGMIESVIAREGTCNKSKERAQQQNRGCKRFGKIFRWNLFFRETDYQGQGFGDFCHFFLNTLNKNQNPPSDFRLHPFFLLVIV